ncbi:MAG TPA: ABC transporter permease [Gemmatimonadales bacterium]|nr:ABC transporter permease [Gemmatimonadales bacterium]
MFTSTLAIGWRTLAANPLRTALSTLGVVIGTAALVAVLALGDGVERYAREQIASQTDLQLFSVNSETRIRMDGIWLPRGDTVRLDVAASEELGSRLGPGVELALTLGGATIVGGLPGDSIRGALVRARAGVPMGTPDSLLVGRYLTDHERASDTALAVISPDLAGVLGGPQAAPGQSLRLAGTVFTVIGVAGQPGEDGPELRVEVPFRSWPRAVPAGTPALPVMLGRAINLDDMPAAVESARAWAESKGADALTVSNRADMLAEVRRGMMVAKLLMGSITGISLIVGGIGIMNVLLASVIERTREIGIRRATGATRRNILGQFLAESVVITAVGSLAGLLLGVSGAFGVSWLMRARTDAPVHAAFTPLPIVVAALSAVIIGLAFGVYPALKASRLAPIDAIRSE